MQTGEKLPTVLIIYSRISCRKLSTDMMISRVCKKTETHAVSITTPNALHNEMAKTILKVGKYVGLNSCKLSYEAHKVRKLWMQHTSHLKLMKLLDGSKQ